MNPIRYFSRIAAVLAGTLVVLVAAGPPAFATEQPPRPPGWNKHPPLSPAQLPGSVHTVVVGGMPGWQIVLIAIAAALVAATAAVFADRAWRHRDHAAVGQLTGEPARHVPASR